MSNYQDGTQNIVFVGPNQHVYQIVASGSSWTNQDVTAAAGLPVAATGSPVTSFATSTVNIAYFGTNGHLYQAVYSGGSWGGMDITAAAGLPAASPASGLASYLDGAQNWVYEGANQHLYQAVFTGSWGGADVTASSGTPVAATASALSTFVDGSAISISFFGTNQHLYQAVYISGQGWGGSDVTASAGAPIAANGSALSTYVNSVQNWVYEGTDQRIYQIAFNGAWSYLNLTAAGSLPLAAPGTAISTFLQGSTISISFFDTSRNLWQAVFTGGQWTGGMNLSAQVGAPVGSYGSGTTSYVTSVQNWVYEAQSGIVLISFTGSWSEVNLSAASGLQWITTPAKEYVYFNGQTVAVENHQ